jgi:outer membrane protein TolC
MRVAVLWIATCTVVAPLARAGDATTPGIFPRWSWFSEHLSAGRTNVELQDPIHLTDYLVEGRLELSLRAYTQLVLENNTDITLARLQVVMPADAVTRAMSAYDPAFNASFTATRSTVPTTSILQGAPTLSSLTQPAAFSYQQTLPDGLNYNVTFTAERTTSNSSYVTLNPALSAGLSVQFSEPLLSNRFGIVNKLNVLIVKSNLAASRHQSRNQINNLLASALNAYWDLVQARENLTIQKRFLELRKAALDRIQKQADAGAALPVDLFQPRSAYAAAQVVFVQAAQSLAHATNALRSQIGADLDPVISTLPVVLSEPYACPSPELPAKEVAIQRALALRPDRLAGLEMVSGDDLHIRSATEELRPNLSLNAGYTSQGVGGVYNSLAANGATITSGLGDTLRQVFGFGFPVYTMGVTLTLPMRGRAAAADLADAAVQKKTDLLQLRKIEQALRLQIANSLDDLETVKSAMADAEVERQNALKRVEAEQRKYELGVTQVFFVLDAQTELNQAESDLLMQSIAFRRDLIAYHLAVGDLLDDLGFHLQ